MLTQNPVFNILLSESRTDFSTRFSYTDYLGQVAQSVEQSPEKAVVAP